LAVKLSGFGSEAELWIVHNAYRIGAKGPDDADDFEVKFLKRFNRLGNGFVFPDREVFL